MKVLLFASLLAVAFAAPSIKKTPFQYCPELASQRQGTSGRIINGDVAADNSIPYQAFLRADGPGGNWACGGSLITENVVLTSGQCAYGASTITVSLGAVYTDLAEVTTISLDILVHEKFDINTKANDIALIKIYQNFNLSSNVQLVKLPTNDNDDYIGNIGTISGWGLKNRTCIELSDELRYSENPIVKNSECEAVFGSIEDTQMCLSDKNGRGPCFGDNGDPLTVDGVQVGLVSYGATNCAPGNPSVITRISKYLDWIKKNSA